MCVWERERGREKERESKKGGEEEGEQGGERTTGHRFSIKNSMSTYY